MGILLLAASVPLSGCVIEPDHDHDRGYVEGGDHHDHDHDHDRDCDRDHDRCDH
jgi:hypothetical protein